MLRLRQRTAAYADWVCPPDMDELLWKLLKIRGIASVEEARAFLNPGVHQLHDPMRMHGVAQAVPTVRLAISKGQRICVYGDYDADGVCASAMLTMFLRSMGADVTCYIPSRHDEGYGLNVRAVEAIATEGAKLLITVDLGVSGVEEVALARSLGMEVVVTDHHRLGESLPDCTLVHPALGEYPTPHLCGAGVAFKLIEALGGRENALVYVDLAAIATVADVVPLTGENRTIVALGLDSIRRAPRSGVEALILSAGLRAADVTSYDIAFRLAPRINAGGRVAGARVAFDLLTGGGPTGALAAMLERDNAERKRMEQEILDAARVRLKEVDLFDRRAIVLAGEDWNIGVVGLAASRLMTEYGRPTVLLTAKGDDYVGSCRSIAGLDIHRALTACAETLTRFGGHAQAAGLSMRRENLAEFECALEKHLQSVTSPGDFVPGLDYDLDVPLGALTRERVTALAALEPTGMGNPSPLLITRARVASARGVGADGKHLKLSFEGGLGGISFGQGARAVELSGTERSLAFAPRLNTWAGVERVELDVRTFLPESVECAAARFQEHFERYAGAYLNALAACDAPVPSSCPTDESALAEWLNGSPQGTLMAAVTREGSARAMRLVKERGLSDRLDVLVGRWPDAPVPHNALCLCPLGTPAARYRRLVLWDMPPEALALDGTPSVYSLSGGAAGWFSELPDVDALRVLYVHLKVVGGVQAATREQLCAAIAGAAGLTPLAVATGLGLLRAWGLVEEGSPSPRVLACSGPKLTPEHDPRYQRICAVRAYEGR